MSLKGKHALITGSSRGIGRGIALKLAERGVKVAVNYYQNEAAAKDTLAKIRERGSDGFLIQADVCHAEEIGRMFNRVKAEFGKLDILVSNARTEVPTFYQGPMEITLDKWDTAIDSQAKAFLLGAREASRLMSEKGRIITKPFKRRRPRMRRRQEDHWFTTDSQTCASRVTVFSFVRFSGSQQSAQVGRGKGLDSKSRTTSTSTIC